MSFLKKKLEFIIKIDKFGKFAVECVSNIFFSKKCFLDVYEVLLAKNPNTLNAGKSENYDEERVFFRERKRFHLLRAFFTKLGRRQNMPVVAGCLLLFFATVSSNPIFLVTFLIIFWTAVGLKIKMILVT